MLIALSGFFVLFFWFFFKEVAVCECRLYLVSEWDRLGYCYFCGALVLGLFLVSLVGANKGSFHRYWFSILKCVRL